MLPLRLLAALCVLVGSFGLGDAAWARAASVPKLGRVWTSGVEGYGSVRPKTINNNGDATSWVTGIRWTDWGQPRAIGHGKGYWIWPGQSNAAGAILSRATVVAWDLSTCQGVASYNKVTWYFPGRGDRFDTRNFRNTCTGDASVYSPPAVKCGSTALRSPPGVARQIVAYGLTCVRARRIVASAPALAHLDGSRFRSGRFYCSSGAPRTVHGPPPTFTCGRGEATIMFSVTRSPSPPQT